MALYAQDMSKCTFTGHKTLENMHKPLVLKELRKLWNKEEPDLPWEEGDYSASNTILVDDSPYKALRNPVLLQPLLYTTFQYIHLHCKSHTLFFYLSCAATYCNFSSLLQLSELE
jgi:hypothetical protein